jgi:hypothetical protein
MQVAAETRENRDNCGRSNATGINNTNEDDDGMQSYNVKTGYIEVRFMTGNSKGFNVARALKQFLAATREQDNEFTILPLASEQTYQITRLELNSIFDMMLSLTTSMTNLGSAPRKALVS